MLEKSLFLKTNSLEVPISIHKNRLLVFSEKLLLQLSRLEIFYSPAKGAKLQGLEDSRPKNSRFFGSQASWTKPCVPDQGAGEIYVQMEGHVALGKAIL